ncbi:MAG: 50S ribosomal protein L19 [Chlamydiales bacterium]|nr:50S ribosomal protein L19 [Chlamydiales bacterium]
MKQNQVIQAVEEAQLKENIPSFRVGDTINVHMRIAEGEKERIQLFSGTVIAKRGSGLSETVALYRFSYGAGMERVFMLHSPRISKIEVVKIGKVRKSKLYYLRGTSGKASKVKEQIGPVKAKATTTATT